MTPQEEIKAWLDSGRDYSAGIALLQRYGKNKILAAGLAKPGKERMEQNHKKLAYELGKLAGSSQLVVSSDKPVASRQLPVASSNPEFGTRDFEPESWNPEPGTINSQVYPQPIRRLKMEYGELYNRRSMLHRLMREVPEENSPANMEKRASLFAEISQATDRIEVLYAAHEKWIRLGTIPDEKELWPEAPPPVTNELPDDIESLKKLKKNLQTNNVKDRNLLEFQGRTKGDDAQPMPEGPKRKLIEKRIKEREEMIVKVELKLQEIYLRGNG